MSRLPNINNSDKHFWHHYTEIYTPIFNEMSDAISIVEIGLLQGDSIAWLAELFPKAHLVGIDVLPIQDTWPRSERISYFQADQNDRHAISEIFASLPNKPNLIIEDGSHIPQHQAHCLVEGFRHLHDGGLYVLEDICTSHPLNSTFSHYSLDHGRQLPTALHVLLALQHLQATHKEFTSNIAADLSSVGFFTPEELHELAAKIADIQIHRRSKLPLRCYACGGSTFDYVKWTCRCGVELYDPTNSMTALIWKDPPPGR